MEVILAKTAGFCFGVKKAVDLVYKTIKDEPLGSRIYTYGPIIHNDEVIKELEKKGVYSIEDESAIRALAPGSILIIRSHGVGKRVYDLAGECGLEVMDATCPFVKKIHGIVERDSAKGRHIIIIGDRTHPEVFGICGWAKGPYTVIKDEEEAKLLELEKKCEVSVVSQTTFNLEKFQYVVEIIKQKGYNELVYNTICSATRDRQKEAAQVSKKADMMLVVGDKKSSNTRKLYEICRSNCNNTYYIQTVKELPDMASEPGICVGITAGASTPDHIIQEVFNLCQMK